LACASAQNGTPASEPARPGGSETVTSRSNWSESLRESVIVLVVGDPAWVGSTVDAMVGANEGLAGHGAPAPSASTANADVTLAGVAPLYGVSVAVVVAGPHVDGLMSTASSPPLKLNVKLVNGICGRPEKWAVTWPVAGSTSLVPASLTRKPGPLTTTNSRNRLWALGAAK